MINWTINHQRPLFISVFHTIQTPNASIFFCFIIVLLLSWHPILDTDKSTCKQFHECTVSVGYYDSHKRNQLYTDFKNTKKLYGNNNIKPTKCFNTTTVPQSILFPIYACNIQHLFWFLYTTIFYYEQEINRQSISVLLKQTTVHIVRVPLCKIHTFRNYKSFFVLKHQCDVYDDDAR